ncbi:hypothetical protein N9L68_04820 [bacterium]|nr:hypothetical protein [bacterium]
MDMTSENTTIMHGVKDTHTPTDGLHNRIMKNIVQGKDELDKSEVNMDPEGFPDEEEISNDYIKKARPLM